MIDDEETSSQILQDSISDAVDRCRLIPSFNLAGSQGAVSPKAYKSYIVVYIVYDLLVCSIYDVYRPCFSMSLYGKWLHIGSYTRRCSDRNG
jgi:hypothetical protein